MDTKMKATIAPMSSTFLIIIVSLKGAISRQDTCNFDDGLCGWVQGEADNFNWTRTSGNGSTINTGPKSGHTTGNDCAFDDDFCLWEETKDWKFSPNEAKSGIYATMVIPQGCVPHTGHSLSTPVHAMQGPVCISFLYFLNGSDNRLRLYINSQDNEYVIESVISSAGSNSTWSIVSTFVNESFPNFTLVFEMYPGPSCLGKAELKNISVVMGKCRGSTVINKTTYPHLSVSELQTTSSADFSVAAIIGSIMGSLVFVVVLAIVAVCIFRKRRQKKKKPDFIEYRTVSSKLSGTVRKVENRSNAEHSVKTGFTPSPNISHTNDTSTVNVKVTMENYSYVTSFVAKPTHRTDNTYDTSRIETKPCLDGTYDHVSTHYNDLRDKTYESDDVSCSKSDGNQEYDHVTKTPDGVYDKTCDDTRCGWSK